MKAIIQDRYGPPGVLRLADVPRPSPGPGQVLIQVRAASVHADVWHVVHGVPYVLRVMGAGLRQPVQPIPGTDVAGVVVELGPGAAGLAPGDEVFGEVIVGMQWRNGGSYAEYAVAPVEKLAPKPTSLSYVAAAAIPTSAIIALQAVRRDARVCAGDRVLVNGAAGGVGLFVLQIAKDVGATVTAVDRAGRLDVLRENGADHVIDYGAEDFTHGPQRYDVVIDIPGNHHYSQIRHVLSERGRYVLIGHDQYGATGHRVLGSVPRVLGLVGRSLFDGHLPAPDFTPPGAAAMREVAALAERGVLRPEVERTYPLAEAAEALAHLESGRAQGRVVLVV
jgi:NADPH:quinone reductase-like Zn-dependent oxidoreductase